MIGIVPVRVVMNNMRKEFLDKEPLENPYKTPKWRTLKITGNDFPKLTMCQF